MKCREPATSEAGCCFPLAGWGRATRPSLRAANQRATFFTVKSQCQLQRMGSTCWLMRHSPSSPCFMLLVYSPRGVSSHLNKYRFRVINTIDLFTEQTASKNILILCYPLNTEYFSNLSIILSRITINTFSLIITSVGGVFLMKRLQGKNLVLFQFNFKILIKKARKILCGKKKSSMGKQDLGKYLKKY